MKKFVYLLTLIIILVLFSDLCLGIIELNDTIKSRYNLGDNLITSGSILLDKDMSANFKIKMNCGEEEILMMMKSFYIKKNTKQGFDEELFIPPLPETRCRLIYELTDKEDIVERTESKEIEVIKSLDAEIYLDKNEFQLGENILLKGSVKKINGDNIDGIAMIELKKDDEKYVVVNSKIKNSIIEEDIHPLFLPGGEYLLSVYIKDSLGNDIKIEGIKLRILNSIDLATSIEKEECSPGDEIKVTGNINNLDELSKDFAANILLGEYKEEFSFSDKFKHQFKIPDDVKSYENMIIVEVYDKFGNMGTSSHKIYVHPIIKEISIKTDGESYHPNQTMLVYVTTTDQAGDVIYEDTTVTIKKGFFKIYENSGSSKDAFEYLINEDLGGKSIKIMAESGGIESYKNIFIDEAITEIEENDENKKGIISSITGSVVGSMNENWGKMIVLVVMMIVLFIALFLSSHLNLKKEFKRMFHEKKDKEEKIQDELKNRISEKHKENKEMEKKFNKYVDPAIAKQIIRTKDEPGSKKENVTVLFADMRGFTGFAEKEDPKNVADMLNTFYRTVNSSVKMYNGIIDQMVGDQVFAMFNVVKKDDNHKLNAIKAALKIVESTKEINKKLMKDNKKMMKIGIGINSGDVVLGTVGSNHMLRYTAVGNTVNLGARLQSKASHNQILVTEEMYKTLKNDVEAEDMGLMNFKNISKQINVYNIVKLK